MNITTDRLPSPMKRHAATFDGVYADGEYIGKVKHGISAPVPGDMVSEVVYWFAGYTPEGRQLRKRSEWAAAVQDVAMVARLEALKAAAE